jgi:hypothetical protein
MSTHAYPPESGAARRGAGDTSAVGSVLRHVEETDARLALYRWVLGRGERPAWVRID